MREGFRKNSSEIDPDKIAAALKAANSSIGYVKMMTPKHLHKDYSDSTPSDGVTRIIIGEKANAGRAPTSNWTGSNMVRRRRKRCPMQTNIIQLCIYQCTYYIYIIGRLYCQ